MEGGGDPDTGGLSRNNEMLERLIHSIADEIWICDAEGKLSLVNQAAVDGPFFLGGKEVRAPVAKILFGLEIYDSNGSRRTEEDAPLIRSLRGETLKDVEEMVRHSETGEMIYRQVSSFPIRNKRGQIIGAVAHVRDISRIKEAEEQLRKSELLLKQTQSCTKVGGWELDVATGLGRVTDEVYRIYSLRKEDFDRGGIELAMSFYDPESRPILEKAFDGALKRGEPYDLDLKFVRAGGERIWVRTMGLPEVKNGKVVRVYGNIMDITDRKRVEQECNEVKVLLEKVYSSLDEAVFVVDPGTRTIVSCNDAASKIFGYPKAAMIGKGTRFLHLNKKMYDSFGRMLAPALDTCGTFHAEFTMRKKEGAAFPTEHTVKSIKDDSGARSMDISVVRDLTEQKKAAEELNKKEEELERKNTSLQEMNTALNVLLKHLGEEQEKNEESLLDTVNNLIIPHLERIRKAQNHALRQEYIDILEANLGEILKPHMHRISEKLIRLSPSEARIANYIKRGYRIKEIAALLHVSTRTIEYHRENIRKKLGIKNRKINLKSYLSGLS